MVTIIENRASIKGKILSVIPNEKLPEYSLITMLLESADDIEGFPNLAKQDVGNEIKINIKTSELNKRNIAVNKELSFDARKAFGQCILI